MGKITFVCVHNEDNQVRASGQNLLGTESAYNIGAGIIGKDVTQPDEQGNSRQMPVWERGL